MNTFEAIKQWFTPGADREEKTQDLKRKDTEALNRLRTLFQELEDEMQHQKHQDG